MDRIIKHAQSGFSLVEALVALTLFTVFFAGGITLLTVFETESRETESIRVVQDQGYAFLIDWANYARQYDEMDVEGDRPDDSVLDVFDVANGIDFISVTDLSFADQRTAQKIQTWQNKLETIRGIQVDKWVLTTSTPASPSEIYRTITLEVNDNQELSWHICCAD